MPFPLIPLLMMAGGAGLTALTQASAARGQARVEGAALAKARERQALSQALVERTARKEAPQSRAAEYDATKQGLTEQLLTTGREGLEVPLFDRGRTSQAYTVARDAAGVAGAERLTADAQRLAAANAWGAMGQNRALDRSQDLSLAGLYSLDAGRTVRAGQEAARQITPNPWVQMLGGALQAYGGASLGGALAPAGAPAAAGGPFKVLPLSTALPTVRPTLLPSR